MNKKQKAIFVAHSILSTLLVSAFTQGAGLIVIPLFYLSSILLAFINEMETKERLETALWYMVPNIIISVIIWVAT